MRKGRSTYSITGGKTYHVFSVAEPNGSYPDFNGWGIYKVPHESEDLSGKQIYELIMPHVLELDPHGKWLNPPYELPEYYYHGRFHGENFIEIDERVKKMWETKLASSKFGL